MSRNVIYIYVNRGEYTWEGGNFLNPGQLDTGQLDTGQLDTGQLDTRQLDT